jgi:hypothetical protein
MFKKSVTYHGTITGPDTYGPTLTELGITYDSHDGQAFVGCVAGEEAVEKLDPFWGLLYWSLEKVTKVEEVPDLQACCDPNCCEDYDCDAEDCSATGCDCYVKDTGL